MELWLQYVECKRIIELFFYGYYVIEEVLAIDSKVE